MIVLGNFILTEVLYAIVYFIAILVLKEFIHARDGMLRKIMIAYFAVEAFTYILAALYFWNAWASPKHLFIDPNVFRLVIILPKVAIKLWLLWWLKRGRYHKSIDSFH